MPTDQPQHADYVRPSDVRIAELEAENERLRSEIRRLKREGCYPAPRTDWAGMFTCSSCGETFSIGSHILGSTTHVCPTHIDGSDAGDACGCPCHQVVQPGLVPCPRCEQEGARP